MCGEYGKCDDSKENEVKCNCESGYSGKLCTFKTDEFTQIESLGSVINRSIAKNNLPQENYLKIGLNITY